MSRQIGLQLLITMIVAVLGLTACQQLILIEEPVRPEGEELSPSVADDFEIAHFVLLAEHLEYVAAAEYGEYVDLEDVHVESEEAFEEMKRHILVMYEGVDNTHSFIYYDQHVDCITIETQPSVLLHKISLEDIDFAEPETVDVEGDVSAEEIADGVQYVTPQLTPGQLDDFGNEIFCEWGTIPLRRLTLEEMVRFVNLDRYFSKSSDGNDQLPIQVWREELLDPQHNDAHKRKYALGWQDVTNFGGSSTLNLWKPKVPDRRAFSLSQQWYLGVNQPKTITQTVEGGWHVYEQKYGHDQPVLFIFMTANSYLAGYHKGYNHESLQFVQHNHKWVLGERFPTHSVKGGTQKMIGMRWHLIGGRWWLYLRGGGNYEPVGFYPASAFDKGSITESAVGLGFGGEVYQLSNGGWPEMGSGEFANKGGQQAAFQSHIYYLPDPGFFDSSKEPVSLTPAATASQCFTVDYYRHRPEPAGTQSGRPFIFFGGPGGRPGSNACIPLKEFGVTCSSNQECRSDHCPNSYRCAPKDFTGAFQDYCHHDNHCSSRRCSCNNFTRGRDSFCTDWSSGNTGTCLAKRANGHDCTRHENCESGYCPDTGAIRQLDWWTGSGGRCAPRNGTGRAGAYCHHNNHCHSGQCSCPAGQSGGFCSEWWKYDFNASNTVGRRQNPYNLTYQINQGFFQCK